MTSRAQPPSERALEAAALRPARGRRHRDDETRFLTIAEVAERLRVCTRTVHRWIEADYLIAHRIGGVVRIAERDLRAFLALHREG